MKASALKNISISDCPITGAARVVDQLRFIWDDEYNQLVQKFRVFYVDTEGSKILDERLKPYDREVYASNFWLVNPATGEVVLTQEDFDALPEEERPEGLMGEYDFFLIYAENSIELYPLLLQKAVGADVKKRFD